MIENIDKVFIDSHISEGEVARRAYKLFGEGKVELVTENPLQDIVGELSPEQFKQSKRLLHIKELKEAYLLKLSAHEYILNLGQQCTTNCSYDRLQMSPVAVIYANLNKALSELEVLAQTAHDQKIQVSTNEGTDSLNLDFLTLNSVKLIEFFKKHSRWSLELKTKSAQVEQFLNTSHAGNVTITWSLNAQNIIDTEEEGTASLQDRLSAARKCFEKGFPIAFHLDPIVWHPRWESSYHSLVKEIADRFAPEEMPDISLAALNYPSEQRHVMRERFGMSHVLRGEMFVGKDGLLRYDQKLREDMFRKIIGWFHEKGSLLPPRTRAKHEAATENLLDN